MSKIVICSNHLGMLENYRGELIREISKNNQVYILAPMDTRVAFFSEINCKVIDINLKRRGTDLREELPILKKYYSSIKRIQPDMVISYSIKPNLYMGLICRFTGISYYAHIQGLGSAFESKGAARIATLFYKIAMKKVRCIFFENNDNCNTFINGGIVDRKRTIVLSGAGVNLVRYSYKKYPNNESCRFLFSGRVTKEKGIDELIHVIKRLNAEGFKVKLDVAGFYEDNYRERIEKLVSEGLVHYYGFLDDPRIAYENADCVVIPSYHEGMCNAILEGAATGRPVVATNIPGCREGIIENVTGFLCQVKSVDSLYLEMKKIVEMSREERIDMGIRARNFMEESFDRKNVVQKTMEILNI